MVELSEAKGNSANNIKLQLEVCLFIYSESVVSLHIFNAFFIHPSADYEDVGCVASLYKEHVGGEQSIDIYSTLGTD